MAKPSIFISYSHKDEDFKKKLVGQIYLLELFNQATVFDPQSIQPGQEWSDEIQKSIINADIVILLISPDFLSSEYIIRHELPAILKRHDEKGQILIPILTQPAPLNLIPELRKFQIWPKNGRALSELSSAEIDRQISDLYNRVDDLVKVISAKEENEVKAELVKPGRSITSDDSFFFVSHERSNGDFAELLQLRLEKEKIKTWIDVDRLSAGDDWKQEIDSAIMKAKAVIVIMSPEARQSEYVTYEWAFALGNKKPVIPILLKGTSLHPRLATLQYLDFTNGLSRPWDKLIHALNKMRSKS